MTYKNTEDDFVDLNNIAKDAGNRYDWKNSIGRVIKFKYDGIYGECKIIGYIDSSHIIIECNGVKIKKLVESIRRGTFEDAVSCLIKSSFEKPIPYNYAKYAKVGDYIQTKNSIIKVLSRQPSQIEYECTRCKYINHKRIGKLSSSGNGCPVCINQVVKVGYNDMWTTNPKLANKLYNPDDGFKYTEKSNKKLDWKCDRCNDITGKASIKNVNSTGRVICQSCSKSISFPNKFADAVFKLAKIEYKREVMKPEWFNGVRRRYDFLIENTFVELDGGYGHGNKENRRLSVSEQIAIDEEKDKQAIDHGYNIVRINCNYKNNRFNFMKQALFSNDFINSIIDINSIDFDKVYEMINVPLQEICIKYWEDTNLSPEEIANELKIHVTTVRRYLHLADAHGRITYTRKDSWYRTRHMEKKEKVKSDYNYGRKQIKMIFKNGLIMNFNSLKDMRETLNVQKQEYSSWKLHKNYAYKKDEKKKLFESIDTIYENDIIVYQSDNTAVVTDATSAQ